MNDQRNDWKTLALTDSRANSIHATVRLPGVLPTDKLTPKMARRASRIVFGHSSQVTVWDNEHDYGYRLYARSARKLKPTD